MSRFLGVALLSVTFAAGCASPDGDASKAPAAAVPASTQAAASRMTVGDLMAKSGKRLTAAEMKQLHTGATIRGSNQHVAWTRKQGADGKFSGQSTRYMGGTGNFHGDWRIDDEGRNCSLFRSQAGAKESCTYYYSLDGKYYTALTDSPTDSAVLEEREISR